MCVYCNTVRLLVTSMSMLPNRSIMLHALSLRMWYVLHESAYHHDVRPTGLDSIGGNQQWMGG